jgi:hypothetical protein
MIRAVPIGFKERLAEAARIDSTAAASFETAAIARWIFQPASRMVVALI